MSEEEVKALVEMKDMLKVENAKLKQEKEDLIKWLDIKIKHISWFDNSGYTRGEYNTLKEILEKLGE